MKSLRRTIRKLILEAYGESNAKTMADLVPGVHKIIVDNTSGGVNLRMTYEGEEMDNVRMTVLGGTGNRKVHQLGAAYVEDPRAEGFGPLLSDICMELTTEKNKWLAIDRSTVSDDARKMWQFYKNHRLDDDVEGWQLDTNMNFLTPEDDDNIDTQMADEHFYYTRYATFYRQAPDKETAQQIKKNYYTRSALMWGFKKQPTLISQLRNMPDLYEEN